MHLMVLILRMGYELCCSAHPMMVVLNFSIHGIIINSISDVGILGLLGGKRYHCHRHISGVSCDTPDS